MLFSLIQRKIFHLQSSTTRTRTNNTHSQMHTLKHTYTKSPTGLQSIGRASRQTSVHSLQRLDHDSQSVRSSLVAHHRVQGQSAPRQGKPDAMQNAASVQAGRVEAAVDREFGAADSGRSPLQDRTRARRSRAARSLYEGKTLFTRDGAPRHFRQHARTRLGRGWK